VVRQEKKGLVDARDKAVSQRDRLAGEIKKLEERKVELQELMDRLMKEKESLISMIGELKDQANSLFYLVDSEKNLKTSEILKKSFLKSMKFIAPTSEHYNKSIDLRSQNSISIFASEFSIGKIKSVELYPNLFKRGTDYTIYIAPDKQTASVVFLEPAEFKNKQLVIAVK
jgi:predicted nuclease with TOPRIM domain